MSMLHSAELNAKFAISTPPHNRLLNLDRQRLSRGIKLQPQLGLYLGRLSASHPAAIDGHILHHSFAAR